MNVTRFLTARVIDGNAIILETTDQRATFNVLGSSLKTNYPKMDSHFSSSTRSLVIYPEQGEKGIIALSLYVHLDGYHKGQPQYSHLPVFLEVSVKLGKPWIDLDQTWQPTERVGMVFDYKISVEIKGRTFVLDRLGSTLREKKPGIYALDDGDLLCRYLYGTAKAYEVLHAVVQEKLEPTRQHVVSTLTTQVRQLTPVARDAELLLRDRDETAAFCGDLYQSYAAVRTVALDAKWLSDLIKKGRWALFFISKEGKEKMATFVEAFEAISGDKLENKLSS